jgi:hypothetical protein
LTGYTPYGGILPVLIGDKLVFEFGLKKDFGRIMREFPVNFCSRSRALAAFHGCLCANFLYCSVWGGPK